MSWNIPLIIFYSFFRAAFFIFLSSIDWVLRILVFLSVWGKIHGSLEGLDMKIGEQTSKIMSDRPWGAAPTRAPQERLCPTGSGTPRQPEYQRLPGDPIPPHPQSFRSSF